MDLSGLRPAGGKRSSKRDRILEIFLAQKGHVTADELYDLVRREDPGIGRATVYRSLQWMVTAGIAHKVDFGEGRSRFEPSLRHPRHFHLICTQCHQSSEFLSSDIEVILEEVAGARNFETVETEIKLFGICQECRTGTKAATLDGAATELVFARDALRIAVATERSGLDFYARAAALASDPRGREVFQRLAEDEQHHLGTLERRYAELSLWADNWRAGTDSTPRETALGRLQELEHLRFGRLCAYLQSRRPDALAGYSILIFRLSDAEVARALTGPSPESPPAAGQP